MEDANGEMKQNREHTELCETETDVDHNEHTPARSGIHYRIDESPPLQVVLFVSMQHLMICFASSMTLSIIIGDVVCTEQDNVLRSRLFNTALCMSGLNTVLQAIVGCRLPVFQGPSFTFITPLIALGADPSWSCSSEAKNSSHMNISEANATVTDDLGKISTMEKLQQMSGSLMAASAVEVMIGALGLVGPLLRRVGPVTVAPTIILIGLSLYKVPVQYSRPSPLMAVGSAVLVILFSLYLQGIKIPITCGKKKTMLPIFQVLPVLLTIGLMWTLAAILTICGVFTDDPESVGYLARTDGKSGLVDATPWLLVTYPGQFGVPSFNVAAFVGFTGAVVSSVVESVGDYLAAARSCEVPPPPQHAVSRGLLLEGLGSVLNGAYGACHATATYSGNIALLSICRTASRSVLVIAGVFLIAVSLVGKMAAALSTVPEPILGGVFVVVLGMLVGIGISTLKNVDLHSTRNLMIVGVSIFIGMVLPDYVTTYPEIFDTGNHQADQVLRVVLGTPMIVGGLIACFLDNTVRGTLKERGLQDTTGEHSTNRATDSSTDWENMTTLCDATLEEQDTVYGWKWYPALLRKFGCLRYVPFLPPQ